MGGAVLQDPGSLVSSAGDEQTCEIWSHVPSPPLFHACDDVITFVWRPPHKVSFKTLSYCCFIPFSVK